MFPATNPSVLMRAQSDDGDVRDQAFAQLARVYYVPIYKHLRLKWRKTPEQAEELTQHFFVQALEREMFSTYDSDKARFRTFVRVCIDRVTMNYDAADRAQKRGGHLRFADVDTHEVEAELAAVSGGAHVDAEASFEREWARSVLAIACERVQAELEAGGRTRQWQVFSLYDLSDEDISYRDLADKLGVPVTTVTNDLSRARKACRSAVLATLRELTASPDEFEHEARALLGAEAARELPEK